MLGSMLVSILRAYVRVYIAENVPSSGIWSVLESMLVSILQNILGGVTCTWNHIWRALGSVFRASFRVYSQAGWECVIGWNWECTSDHAREGAICNHVSKLGSVQ